MNVSNEVFIEGVEELDTVIKYIRLFGVPEENCKINLSIVRGLDYYTGTVYETFLDDYPSLGSICSGEDMITWLNTIQSRSFQE